MLGLRQILPTGRIKDTVWDFIHGVDTGGIVPSEAPHGVRYEATSPQHFQVLMRKLPPELIGRSSFIDMGSGKGRVLLLAAGYPFRRVLGVEYSEQLHEVARKNIASYRGPRQCASIDSIHGDAGVYQFPDGPLVVFFNNPFHSPVMTAVVENLKKALREEPRDAALLCITRWTKTDIIETIPGIRKVSQGADDALFLIGQLQPRGQIAQT
jgi:SAM-dependent methyltransferase